MSCVLARIQAARERLPLKRLMEQHHRGPANGNWKRFPRCPYCGKDSAGVFRGGYGDLFKCHHASCPSGTQHQQAAWDEIGFLAYELGLSRRDAVLAWFREAGIP